MPSGLSIKIPAVTYTQGPPTIEELKTEINVGDSENELPKETFMPNGTPRYASKRWAEWELIFVRECFKTTRNPPGPLRDSWALKLTEERLRRVRNSNPSDKENDAKIWLKFYKRRLANWFKNRKARLRHEGDFPLKKGSSAASTSTIQLTNRFRAVRFDIISNNPTQLSDDNSRKTFSPGKRHATQLEEEPPSGGRSKRHRPSRQNGETLVTYSNENTIEEAANGASLLLDNMGLSDLHGSHLYDQSRLEELASQACLREELPVPDAHSEERTQYLDRYDADVILGATLLVKIQMDYKRLSQRI